MVEFKPSMKKEELLDIAAANGIAADDGMTKTQIIEALNAHNAQEAAGTPTEGAAEGAENAADGEGGGDTSHGEKPAERPTEGEEDTGGSGTGDGGGEQPAEEATEGAGSDGTGGGGNDTPGGEKPAERPTEGAGSDGTGGGGNDTPGGEKPAERPTEGAEGYDTFVYCGPSIPRGRLKENAVFRGTLADVLNYLADVIEDYPQIPRLIVPTNRLAAFSVKVKTPGNIAHKYYTDIVSAMKMKKNSKEG